MATRVPHQGSVRCYPRRCTRRQGSPLSSACLVRWSCLPAVLLSSSWLQILVFELSAMRWRERRAIAACGSGTRLCRSRHGDLSRCGQAATITVSLSSVHLSPFSVAGTQAIALGTASLVRRLRPLFFIPLRSLTSEFCVASSFRPSPAQAHDVDRRFFSLPPGLSYTRSSFNPFLPALAFCLAAEPAL